jgi:alpha-N-arabinofuranosidase
MYFENYEKNTAEYLALAHKLDTYIGTISGVIDYVKAKRRSKREVRISFDEWNVWYHERKADAQRMREWDWPEAPRLLEDIYNMEDVLQVGGILNTFIRRSDVVRIACIAQLVNVIAPIMTEPGGAAWRQTIYYPFLFASKHGRGTALDLAVEVPTYDAAAADRVPWLDIAGVHDADGGTLSFFAINRHGTETMETDLALERFKARSVEHTIIRHDDLEAKNTRDAPDTVTPQKGDGARLGERGIALILPPHSYSMIRVAL